MAGQGNIYTFIIPDPHPSPLEIIKHQEELVRTLEVLYANIYKNYILSPLLCACLHILFLGEGLNTYENGVDIIDPFLYMFGCKYNNTEERFNINCTVEYPVL